MRVFVLSKLEGAISRGQTLDLYRYMDWFFVFPCGLFFCLLRPTCGESRPETEAHYRCELWASASVGRLWQLMQLVMESHYLKPNVEKITLSDASLLAILVVWLGIMIGRGACVVL